jgi:hypothetical protein
MADLYGVAIGGGVSGNVDANARRILGDGASGAGPFTRFGSRELQAIKVVSATINFATSYTAVNSNFYKAINAIQERAEIFYVGIPQDTSNGFVALISKVNSDSGDGYGASSTADASYDNLEESIDIAVNGSDSGDITITNVTLTGLTFGV